tara:strand:- start:453 stop:1985 length:1533 start_codon:yes stop_codon:yes gene_type:complete
MAKLPEIQQRAIPGAINVTPQQVQVADTTAVTKAMGNFGKDLSSGALSYGQAYEAMEAQKDRFNYSSAKSKFLQESATLQYNIDFDPDYDNAPKNYKEGMAKNKENIRNNPNLSPQYKEVLLQQADLYEEKQYGSVLRNTVTKRTDANIATALIDEEYNSELASKTNDADTVELLKTASINVFNNAIPLTDPNREQKILANTTRIDKKYALADLQKLTLEDQLAVLKQEHKKFGSTTAQYFTPDERFKLENNIVSSIKARDKEQAALAVKAEKEVKVGVQSRLIETIEKNGTWEDLSIQDQFNATEKDKKTFDRLRQRKLGINTDSPTALEANYQEVRDEWIEDPETFANRDELELLASVPSSQQEEVAGWYQSAREGVKAPANIKEQNSIANDTLISIGVDPKKDGSTFKKRFYEDIEAFKQEKNKLPTKYDTQRIAEDLIVERSFKGFLYGTNEERAYQVSKEDFNKNIVVPDNFTNTLILQSQQRNLPAPSEEDISNAYLKKIQNER